MHRAANYATGAAELILGLGLAHPPPAILGNVHSLAHAAVARALFWLVLLMTPANVNMFLNDVPFGSTRLSYGWDGTHALRLSLQLVLLCALRALAAGWRADAAADERRRGWRATRTTRGGGDGEGGTGTAAPARAGRTRSPTRGRPARR